jgi:two-component system chemotaxis response regulator CheB
LSPIRLLIVDDSPTACEVLKEVFRLDGRFDLVGIAHDGRRALKMVAELTPDVVTMDIHMPGMDGFETTSRIMHEHPCPIVIVSSSWDSGSVEKSMKALAAGAVSAMAKPSGPTRPGWDRERRALADTVASMAEVKVVRRRPSRFAGDQEKTSPAMGFGRKHEAQILAIGASTGGPPVLQSILSGLPGDYPMPVVVVQHIAHGFLEGLVSWIDQRTALRAVVAQDGQIMTAGTVYFAPTDRHLEVTRRKEIKLVDSAPEYGTRPSVGHLFKTVEKSFKSQAIGVLLTGMGRDGALELKGMRDAGAVTIIQDKPSSVIWGMPGEADRLGAAHFALPPDAIVEKLKRLAGLWGVLTGEF